MKAVVQRVSRASVAVDGREVSSIGSGLLALVGVAANDEDRDAEWIGDKIATLRIFADDQGALNRAVGESGGTVLVVSQFTLLGDARKGRRPSFVSAAGPERAEPLVRAVAERIRASGLPVAVGVFGAVMAVELVNDGPVTILLDSHRST